MISKKTISELTHKYQSTEVNIIREYCQHLFLSNLYQNKLASRIMSKGGTALRIIYKSPRFSEDLDFTAQDISIKELEAVFLDSFSDIEKTGIEVELEEAKITSGGYLAITYFDFLDSRQAIQLEVSLRNLKKIRPEVNLINSQYLPAFNVISLPEKELVKEKVKALLVRSRPRDFFDIYFLLRSDLSIKKQDLELHKVLNKLEETKIDFKRELRALLPKSHQALLKNFKAILRRELMRYL